METISCRRRHACMMHEPAKRTLHFRHMGNSNSWGISNPGIILSLKVTNVGLYLHCVVCRPNCIVFPL
jgi:hypothetical protein